MSCPGVQVSLNKKPGENLYGSVGENPCSYCCPGATSYASVPSASALIPGAKGCVGSFGIAQTGCININPALLSAAVIAAKSM
jgi:hypothetical protein